MTGQIGRRDPATINQRWTRRFVSLICAERGSAALEFALATPILIALLIPVADLGLAFSEQIQVQQAAQAGAQYAMTHPWTSGSVTPIETAETAATQLALLPWAPVTNPAPSEFCGCPDASTTPPTITHDPTYPTCSTKCSGQPEGYYVMVNAQASYTPQLPYTMLPVDPVTHKMTLSAQSTVRVR